MLHRLPKHSGRFFWAACVFVAGLLSNSLALAQFSEKKVLTLAAAQKMVTAAQGEAERNHLAGGNSRRR